jgi:hypothetical protein
VTASHPGYAIRAARVIDPATSDVAVYEPTAAVVHPERSGRGFKFAPFIGEALADLVEGTPREDLAIFSPQRFTPAP